MLSLEPLAGFIDRFGGSRSVMFRHPWEIRKMMSETIRQNLIPGWARTGLQEPLTFRVPLKLSKSRRNHAAAAMPSLKPCVLLATITAEKMHQAQDQEYITSKESKLGV
ncbi:unnamed protein product [Caretta caretta]